MIHIIVNYCNSISISCYGTESQNRKYSSFLFCAWTAWTNSHRIKTYIRSTRASNRCHAMIRNDWWSKCWRHGPSQCAYESYYPLDVRHFEYFQGGECLSNAHWLGTWRQHFDDELQLRQNHWKIIHRKKQEVGLLRSLFCGTVAWRLQNRMKVWVATCKHCFEIK
jgi:hypothetical protein